MKPLRITAILTALAVVVLIAYQLAPRERERPVPPGLKELAFPEEEEKKDKKEEGHAWEAFEWWYGTRAYPNDLIPKSAFYEAYRYAKDVLGVNKSGARTSWTSIGPDNVGGRVLALAIDPENPNVIWAGAASGGLWRSATAGEGSSAWTWIDTGYPTLSISSIVIDPNDPQVMYVGTGEISRYVRPLVGTPGARSSYGMGVLKSNDRGATWNETGLTWTFDQSRAVLALKMDPVDAQVLWAATSEGLYKTMDGGGTWNLSNPVLMAMDVVIDPLDRQRVYAAHGQLNSAPNPGLYRTTDGGQTWARLAGGLPTSDFGRTSLALHRTSPSHVVIYAGISNGSTRQIIGLFRSTNGGDTWTNVNSTNYVGSQGWYDNVVATSPASSDIVFCGGLDWYRSANGGSTLGQVSYWYNGYGGVITPGGDEGTPDYVHADQHAIVFDPTDPDIVYAGSDGGVFKSLDGGLNWSGKNGGFVTTQFYTGFAGGYTTTALAVGGLQDNGTLKYLGTPSWSKIFGGDGGWCAIDPTNENIIYEEYVYLNMYKSLDGGDSWTEVHPYSSTEANFIAPFVICESSPNILYAGTKGVKKTINGGSSWSYPDGNSNWNGTPIAIIGVSYTSPDTLCAGTGSGSSPATFEIRRSVNGGQSWTTTSAGLPNRYPTHLSYDRRDSRIVWLTFSGYGNPHVYRSSNAGLTWEDRSGNLPDIPVQCVEVDPENSEWIYVGTDLGVFQSMDGGTSWFEMNDGMPPAMVLDLVIKPEERLMRAATFGNGVYEAVLPATAGAAELAEISSRRAHAEPNPFREGTMIRFYGGADGGAEVAIYDQIGRRIRVLSVSSEGAEVASASWDGKDDAGRRARGGVYFARLSRAGETESVKLTLIE
ncbi:MAG: hypothetical protein FJY88_08375 [Candidatus Eisenbacteria bacterium]|nr:hypothetical protein [Candidatus Eisenbacteria bacterium]